MTSNLKIKKMTLKKKKKSQENSEDDKPEGSSTDIDCDQDSDVSFAKDSDKGIDTAEIEQEDWIEYIKRSTAVTKEKLNTAKIPRCIEMHRRMKWKLAMRMASLPKERWVRKTAEWNPGLSSKIRTNRAAGRPKKRWEDEINEFLKSEETEATKGSDVKNNDRWTRAAKQKNKWKDKE